MCFAVVRHRQILRNPVGREFAQFLPDPVLEHLIGRDLAHFLPNPVLGGGVQALALLPLFLSDYFMTTTKRTLLVCKFKKYIYLCTKYIYHDCTKAQKTDRSQSAGV